MSGEVRLELATVARLTIVNPPLNLVTEALLASFVEALATLEAADPGDVRAVVVTGEGERAFSAGSPASAGRRSATSPIGRSSRSATTGSS